MSVVTIEPRRYALHRLAKGDYIAWSNDLTMRYRIHSYEDGNDLGLVVPYRLRTFWRVAQLPAAKITPTTALGDPWSAPWEEVDWYLPTRKAALAKVGLA